MATICETVLLSGNTKKINQLSAIMGKFKLRIYDYVTNPKAHKKYHTGVEYGPDIVKTFNSLAIDGTCTICRRQKKIHPYLNECLNCIQRENEKAEKRFRAS